MAEPLMQPIMIALDMNASGFTSKAGMSHSPTRMERTFDKLESILGKSRICDLGFNIPKGSTDKHAAALNEAEKEMPSMSDIAKADDKGSKRLQKMHQEAWRISTSNSRAPRICPCMLELLGLDKQLRSIRDSLKVEVEKKVYLEQNNKKEKRKLEEIRDHPGVYDDGIQEDYEVNRQAE